MFESSLERTIILTTVGLWFAHGWYLNTRLDRVHKKLDQILQAFEGLRTYLYEQDPQFEDERSARRAFQNGNSMFSGADDMELGRRKRAEGRRTLNTMFIE